MYLECTPGARGFLYLPLSAGLAPVMPRASVDEISEAKETNMYDMKNLSKMSKIGELAPDAFKAFLAFDESAARSGAIPVKYKELMAIAVALTTQCPYCIEVHATKARKAGATEQEIAETTLVAAALRAGGAMTHGTHALL